MSATHSAPSADELHALTDDLVAASRAALEWFRLPPRRPISIDNKIQDRGPGHFDPVTVADRHVEDRIRAVIGAAFPDHAVFGEERGVTGEHRFRWVIDPIDGTRAFISGQPSWGALVGLTDNGVPIAGWMHQPVLDETFVAIAGRGHHVGPERTRPLETRPTTSVSEAILLSTDPTMFVTPEEIEVFERVSRHVQLTRYGGDCVNYGLIAAGFADVVVENQLEPYDIIPLLPILEAAGAIVTDLEGNLPLDGGFVVASANATLHQNVLDLLCS